MFKSWICNKRPNLPAYCKTSRLFKVNTLNYNAPALSELYHLIWEYFNHSFLILHSDPEAFRNAPPNVIPVLHSDDYKHFKAVEQTFRQVSVGRLSGVSLYLKHRPIYVAHSYSIAFLNGTNLIAMTKSIEILRLKKTPCFVESFNFKNTLPEQLNIKEFPPTLLAGNRPSVNLFLYSFNEFQPMEYPS